MAKTLWAVEHGRDGQDLVQQDLLVVGQVLRRDLDHEVVGTRDHVAGHYGRDRHQRPLDIERPSTGNARRPSAR